MRGYGGMGDTKLLKSFSFGSAGSTPATLTTIFWGCEDCKQLTMEFSLYSPDYLDLGIPIRKTCKRLCTPYYRMLNSKEW